MGAFFLSRTTDAYDAAHVARVFRKKGFAADQPFVLGDWTLRLWSKQHVSAPNWVDSGEQGRAFLIGSLSYRGLGYREGLAALLGDVRKGVVDYSNLQGSFVVLFEAGGSLRLLTDELNVGAVFIDPARQRLSSSFLAVLAASTEKWSLNRLALQEKLATGYVVAPDTLVEGIVKASNAVQMGINWQGLSFVQHPNRPDRVVCNRASFNEAVEDQLNAISSHLRNLSALTRDFAPELGLSSGYDSRLLLALCNVLPVTVGVHTHATTGAHDRERRIATELCRLNGNSLRVIPTKQMNEQSAERLAEILDDGLYYYDGRNSAEMGAFSETYTRAYRNAVTEGYALGLSGLGGEIYRNYFLTSLPRLPFLAWMQRHVYYPGISDDFGRYTEMHARVIDKMSTIIGTDLSKWVDLYTLRRYYGEIRMPESNGTVANAHNQLTFYMIPFGEYRVILKAYEATRHIGLCGAFEAAMLCRCNASLAAVDSNYGYPFTRIPPRARMHAAIKGLLPDAIWLTYDRYRLRRGLYQENSDLYKQLCQRHRVMAEIDDVLHATIPCLDVEMATRDARSRGNLVYIGSFLREFATLLRLG
jgi:hypothetical protein